MTPDGSGMVTASDGTRLFVTERGTGEPVLFIPGLGYGTWSWARQMDEVSSVATVLLMDNRGAGRSDKPEGPYSIDQLADDAHAVLAQRSALPAHIVGSSMGGYVALSLALRHPDAVRSLTLIATTSGGPGSVGVPATTLATWAKASHLDPVEYARATMPLSFAPGWVQKHPAEFEELLALRLSAPTPAAAWRAQFAACADFLRAGLPAGELPTRSVIVHGTADCVVPYANAAHLAERLGGAPVMTLRDAGHLCWIERADIINDIIIKTITGI